MIEECGLQKFGKNLFGVRGDRANVLCVDGSRDSNGYYSTPSCSTHDCDKHVVGKHFVFFELMEFGLVNVPLLFPHELILDNIVNP